MAAQVPVPDPISFDRTGPFYDMVMTFISAVGGLEVYFPNNPLGLHQGQPGVGLGGKVHPNFTIDTFDLWQRHQRGELSQPTLTGSLCGMLMNNAYESVKDRNDQSPVFEFFRHVRNASAHRGAFNLGAKEPSRKADWRGIVIDDSLKGAANPLYGKRCFFDLLGAADAILLLWDIEQHLKQP